MEFTKLENEGFIVNVGDNKPNAKFFPDADLKSLGNTKYEFSSSLKKDKMSFFITNEFVTETILNNIMNDILTDLIGDNTNDNYHCLRFSYIENNNVVIFALSHYYGIKNFDYPIQLNFNNNEIKDLEKNDMFLSRGIKLSNKTKFYVVPCRSYIFELIYREYLKVPVDYSFLNNLDPNQTYNDEFFKENKISPRPIIYDNGLINIPIFEKIGENWIFYHHNFDKYKDKIIEQ